MTEQKKLPTAYCLLPFARARGGRALCTYPSAQRVTLMPAPMHCHRCAKHGAKVCGEARERARCPEYGRKYAFCRKLFLRAEYLRISTTFAKSLLQSFAVFCSLLQSFAVFGHAKKQSINFAVEIKMGMAIPP